VLQLVGGDSALVQQYLQDFCVALFGVGIDDEAIAEAQRDQSLFFDNGEDAVQVELRQKHDGICRMILTQIAVENHDTLAWFVIMFDFGHFYGNLNVLYNVSNNHF
jgi:hypothetical protein